MSTPSAIEAALELQAFLEAEKLAFCVIGGVALQRWGETRMTTDADATVLTHWVNDESVADLLLSRFPGRIPNARAFGLQHRVLLLRTASGVSLDIALGALPFEQNAVERSSNWALPANRSLRTCSAEDLIVHKSFASRPQDWIDVESIIIRQRGRLNSTLILEELRPLAMLKEDDTIVPRLVKLLQERDRDCR